MNDAYVAAMGETIDRLEREKESIRGVVVTSAKKTFFAGGNLGGLIRATPETREDVLAHVTLVKSQLRRLETLGRPVAAAINGTALGGGLEIALACHHRVVLDDPTVKLGFPEVTLGLLPGGGGGVRPVRLLRLTAAPPAPPHDGAARAAAAGPADPPVEGDGPRAGARARR